MINEYKTTFALIYCRVSSKKQVTEGHGLDSQEKRCIDRANEKKYKLLSVFREEGLSGALSDRKAMKELISYLDEWNLTKKDSSEIVVIFDDLKRFSRDLQVHWFLKNEIKGRGARIECLNYVFEDSPYGKFVESVLVAAGQLERETNAIQVKQKMKARMEMGYWTFGSSPGYIFKKFPEHGKLLVRHEPLATIYKTAIEGFANRILYTPEDVRDYIKNQYKIYNIDKKISLSGANRLLRNIICTGHIFYPQWQIPLIKGKHEGYIEIETYNRNQEIFKERAKPKSRRDTNPDFPLRNLILCSLCHKPLTASWNTSRNKAKYPNYFCKTADCELRWKIIPRKEIHPEFEKLLETKAPSDAIVNLALAILQDVWDQKFNESISNQKVQQKELQNLTESIENLSKRVAKTIDENLISAYEEQLKGFVVRKKELEAMTQTPQYTKQQFGTASEKVFSTLKEPVKMWRSENLEDKFMVFSLYFDEKPIYNRKTGFGTASLASPIKVFDVLKSSENRYVEMPSHELGSKLPYLIHLQA